jgi:hypothetical protein
VLTEGGLWVEVVQEAWRAMSPDDPEAQVIAFEIEQGERAGLSGRHTVEVTKTYASDPGEAGGLPRSATFSARLVRVDW